MHGRIVLVMPSCCGTCSEQKTTLESDGLCTWKDEGVAFFGLEEVLGVFKDLLEEGSEKRISVVLPRHIHGSAHSLMDVDRSCTSQYRLYTAASSTHVHGGQ